MFRRVQVRERNITLEHTSSNTGGNYSQYFKIFIQVLKTVTQQEFKSFPLKDKIQIYVMIILKTPWWLVIKPLGSLFTVNNTYQGNFYCKFQDDILSIADFSKLNKTTTITFLNKIPIWFYKTNHLSKIDQDLIIEKYL